MSDTTGDIIIKGGSVELIYDPLTYTKDVGTDNKVWKNVNKKIVQIIITDDNDETVYDSGEQLPGLNYTVKARCK
ncbi:MAG TPA: hypothetical protein VEW46_01605 [Pyrinomonadaceae bacterium]|nr:hypothetical protein [Pyrinomonadaceae bacterium]